MERALGVVLILVGPCAACLVGMRDADYFYSSAKIFKSVASHAVSVYNKPWINRHAISDICAASSVRILDVTQLYFSKSAYLLENYQ